MIKKSSTPIALTKLFWFKMIAILLPVIVLLLLEVVLRAFNYGTNYDLFIEAADQEDQVVMNPMVSEKYFTRTENATIGFFENFPTDKNVNTIRIFVLGASTAVGFPYYHNGSFHRMLKWKLQQFYPDTNLELINLSLTAINSYTLQDFARQLIPYHPDAVIIYAGHNEYYGALGVGATSRLGSWPSLVRLTIRAREWKVIQLGFDIYHSMVNFWTPKQDLKENLMKRMVSAEKIPLGSDIFQDGIDQFESNFNKMLSLFAEYKIPVVLGDLISNEKDQSPLVADTAPGVDSISFYSRLFQVNQLLNEENAEQAFTQLQELLKIDSTNAEVHYLLGTASLQSQNFEQAKISFQNAKEFDLLRFRAPEEINQLIDKYTQKPIVVKAEVQKKFREASDHGIIGQSLVLEHLHPNLNGYRIMAEAYFEALNSTSIFDEHLTSAATDDFNWDNYPLTQVDSLYGYYGTLILKEGWPFFEPFELDTVNRSLPEAIAGALVVKQLTWEQAMEKLYQHYHQQEKFQAALRVTNAVIMEYPDRPAFYAKAGSLCLRLKEFQKGAAYFTEAFRLDQNPQYAYYAALCFTRLKEWSRSSAILNLSLQHTPNNLEISRMLKAIEEIEIVQERLRQNEADPELQNHLARLYFLLGLKEDARELAENVLDSNPTNELAKQILEQLNQSNT